MTAASAPDGYAVDSDQGRQPRRSRGDQPIPPANTIINQGGRNLTTSGTQITQPLTSLLKIKHANDIAQAEVRASREQATAYRK